MKTEISQKIAIIAGSGDLPLEISKALKSQSRDHIIIAIKNNTDQQLLIWAATNSIPNYSLEITNFSDLINILRYEKVESVTLAGGINSRPRLREIKLNYHNLYAIWRLYKKLRQGDDALLKSFLELLECYGFKILSASDLLPHLIVKLNQENLDLTKTRPTKAEEESISLGIEFLRSISDFDVGQAVVVAENRIIAVEAAEGTQAMLERVAKLRAENRIASSNMVLVKISKCNQDLRVDLPTIGEKTVIQVKQAGLSGIAIEREKTLLLNKEKLIELADSYGIYIRII